MKPHLALNKHVEEVIAGLLKVSLAHQVSQIVLGDPQAWEAPNINPLVVEAAALRASNQVKQLLSLGGGGNGRIWRNRWWLLLDQMEMGKLFLITDQSCHSGMAWNSLHLRHFVAHRDGSAGRPYGCSGTYWGGRRSSLHRRGHGQASARWMANANSGQYTVV